MMKKILVVLLVLAVATGVFAQEGEWSITGGVQIGTYIDLDSDLENGANEQVVYTGYSWFQPYDYYGPLTGKLALHYNRDALGIEVRFDNFDEKFGGGFTYDGGNYKFQADADLRYIIGWSQGLNAAGDTIINYTGHAGRLWGYYKLLNELVHLEVAYNSRDTEFWASDKSAAFWGAGGQGAVIGYFGNGKNSSWHQWETYVFGSGDTYTKVDHNNYLLADVQLEGLSFGLMAPNLFTDNGVPGDRRGTLDVANNTTFKGFPKATNGKVAYSLVDSVFKQMIFGIKFNMQPIEVAAQLMMEDYGVYFGGKFSAGPVTVGLSFMGLLNITAPDASGNNVKVPNSRTMKVGGNVDFNGGAFGAHVKGFLGLNGITTAANATQIGIEPGFWYNVIPTHLKFQTDIGFYFTNVYNGKEKDTDNSLVTWAVRPQLFWNFLGTGAGDWYGGLNTGMLFRYVIVSDNINALDVTFKWSF